MQTRDYRAHCAQALAVARQTGWNLDTEAADRDWSAIGIGPVGQHRDSDALDRSNFAIVSADLRERFGDAVDTASFGHWGVGWIEEVIFDAGRPDVADAVQAWRDALADYPVADDEQFSQLEWEDNHPHDGRCYSDDPDCGCDRAEA